MAWNTVSVQSADTDAFKRDVSKRNLGTSTGFILMTEKED